MTTRRFEFVSGTSSKFWEVSVAGSNVTIQFGKIGTVGQSTTKKTASPAAASALAEKQIREKTKKGYRAAKVGAKALKGAPHKALKTAKAKQPVPPSRSKTVAPAKSSAKSFDKLRTLLKSLPASAAGWGEPAKERDIKAMEAECGVSFPEDYKSFLREFGALHLKDGDCTLLGHSKRKDKSLLAVRQLIRKDHKELYRKSALAKSKLERGVTPLADEAFAPFYLLSDAYSEVEVFDREGFVRNLRRGYLGPASTKQSFTTFALELIKRESREVASTSTSATSSVVAEGVSKLFEAFRSRLAPGSSDYEKVKKGYRNGASVWIARPGNVPVAVSVDLPTAINPSSTIRFAWEEPYSKESMRRRQRELLCATCAKVEASVDSTREVIDVIAFGGELSFFDPDVMLSVDELVYVIAHDTKLSFRGSKKEPKAAILKALVSKRAQQNRMFSFRDRVDDPKKRNIVERKFGKLRETALSLRIKDWRDRKLRPRR